MSLRQTSNTTSSTEASAVVPAAATKRRGAAESATQNPPVEREATESDATDSLDETEMLGAVFDTLRLLAAVVAVMFFGYNIHNLTRLETPGVRTVMVADQLGLLVALSTFWVTHARRIPLGWAHPAGLVLAVTVAANTSFSAFTYGAASDLQFMVAIALGAGAMVGSVRWLIAVLASMAALGVPTALAVCSRAEFVDFLVNQSGASALAFVVFLGRMKSRRKLLELRRRDEQRARELKAALARAEQEFAEHQLSEQQRLLLAEQLRQAQKLEALGTLAGGVAHDINNVIGAITAVASTTLPELPPGAPGRRELQQILAAARRGTTLTRNLLGFARQDAPRNEPFSLDEVVREVEALLRRTLPKSIDFAARRACPELAIVGDSGLISHALMNLCLNSADAIDGRGSITVETRVSNLDEAAAREYGVQAGAYAELVVCDDGHGMTPAVLERIFEPFFSTKSTKRRTGLGLSMVYSTVQQHHGGLRVTSQPGQGTQITLVLPAYEKQHRVVTQRTRKAPRVNPARRVALFVDDEPLLRRAGKRLLTSVGYEVMLASNGRDALTRFNEHHDRIGVVVLDVAMPVMSGPECFTELRAVDPSIPIVLASGFAKGHDIQSLLSSPNTRYVRKPYELDELAAILAELSQGSELPPPSVRRLTLA